MFIRVADWRLICTLFFTVLFAPEMRQSLANTVFAKDSSIFAKDCSVSLPKILVYLPKIVPVEPHYGCNQHSKYVELPIIGDHPFKDTIVIRSR